MSYRGLYGEKPRSPPLEVRTGAVFAVMFGVAGLMVLLMGLGAGLVPHDAAASGGGKGDEGPPRQPKRAQGSSEPT